MRFIAAICFLMLCQSCEKENRWDCVKSYGDEIVENRTLVAFSGILTESKVDIEYRRADDYYVEVEFSENLIQHIETDVIDGVLTIRNNARCNWVRDLSKKPKVIIYAPGFERLENRGTGDILLTDTLHTPGFQYDQWDSNGDVRLLLHSTEVRVLMHTGNSRVTVAGNCQTANLYSACAGKLLAGNLNSPVALVNNSSIQDMEVFSSDYLYGAVFGSGDILYAGSPNQIDKDIQGSGTVRPR